jgi:pimeloyl-ACP methyl ester carboxylesterase
MPTTLILLPGLGVDCRLFEPQRKDFPDLVCPTWPDPKPRESLESYAERLAALIPRTRPLLLGGISFGAMLAAQMATQVKPDALILISGCTTPSEVAAPLRAAALAMKFVPTLVGDQALAMAPPFFVRALGPMSRQDREFLASLSDALPFSFSRWGTQAILRWRGSPPAPCPTFRIHGDKDGIIPLRKDTAKDPRTTIIRGAGHVPSVSHPGEVNAAIRRVMDSLNPAATS